MNYVRNYSAFFTVSAGILVLLFLIKVFDISYPVTLVTSTKSSELAVVGEGKVEIIPDSAQVEAGTTVNNESSVEIVQEKINAVHNAIVNEMQKLGIQKEDIKTSNYSINPNYVYEGSRNSIEGYNGSASITIKVKNIQLLSNVMGAVAQSGANQIQGANFSVMDPAKYREEARNKAIENAKLQAQKLAKTLGIRLGKISNIVELSPDGINPISLRSLDMAIGGAEKADFQPGTQTITSIVTLYFEKR